MFSYYCFSLRLSVSAREIFILIYKKFMRIAINGKKIKPELEKKNEFEI